MCLIIDHWGLECSTCVYKSPTTTPIKKNMKLFFTRFLLIALFSLSAWAEEFRIDDIRIEGLQRVSAKTVFAALPIKVKTDVSQIELQDAVRELFRTGFFSDIDIAREGNVLIINVSERPAINRIGVTGNSVIETEPLLEGLKRIGLIEGDIFKQSALDQIERELNAQYSAVGRYATEIQTRIQELPQNQINIGIKIVEGEVATIKHINVVGNKTFAEDDLQGLFEIKKTGTWSWVTGSDKYAKQKLAGDLERLKAFYFDRGYLEFETLSTQVSLSPDKKTVFITINIFEGEEYKVEQVELAGDLILPKEEIDQLVTINSGDIFSQRELLSTSDAIKKRFGNEGYSFAKASGVPDLNKEDKTVKVTFFINPGQIYYVRRIIFRGNTTTQDNVLRREMRQLEGAPVSTEKMELSRSRLQRLPLFSEVNMSTQEVPGQPDQLDIVFTVVEQPSGNINASIGYSQGNGLTLGAGLQQSNWLGTGNTFGFQVDKSDVQTGYSLNFTNPYFTQDGVSRGVRIFYQERDLNELEISSYSTDRFGVNVTFGYPISERSRISLGLGIESIKVNPGARSVQEIAGSPRLRSGVDNAFVNNSALSTVTALGFTDENNNDFLDEEDNVPGNITAAALPTSAGTVSDSQLTSINSSGFLDRHGNDFNHLNFNLGWTDSTLDKGIFPTDGHSQKVNAEVSVPGGDLEFYKLTYSNQFYFPLSKNYTLRFKNKLGYADSYGEFDTLPFFENFFAGGSNSVRGFRQSSLGPKGTPAVSYVAVPYNNNGEIDFAYLSTDNAGGPIATFTDNDEQTLGGNILFETGVELVFPMPFAPNAKSVRSIVFIDAGNVFSDSCTATQAACSNLDLGNLSSSLGTGVQWLSPVGPISLYVSKALQKQEFDRTQSFQFSLGQSF